MMPIAERDGAKLDYEVKAREGAPWLVLSHSLGLQRALWDAQMDALGSRFSLLRYDHRGHGKSTATPDPYTVEQMGLDLLAIAQHAGIAKFHLCGLSLGGQVGQWVAVNRPEVLERLVLCNTAAKIGQAEVWNERIRMVEAGGMQAIVDAGALDRWFTPAGKAAWPERAEQMRDLLLSMDREGYVASIAAVRDADFRSELGKIRTPTLVIYGTHDPVTTPADAEVLRAGIAGAQVLGLEAAHLSNLEQAEAFTAAVVRFLEAR